MAARLMRQRTRPSRVGALARTLTAALRRGPRPYVCSRGGHRIYRPQRAAVQAGSLAPCPRPGCGGVLHRPDQTDRLITDLLSGTSRVPGVKERPRDHHD